MAVVISSDMVRKELAGSHQTLCDSGYGEGYTLGTRARTYAEIVSGETLLEKTDSHLRRDFLKSSIAVADSGKRGRG